MNRQEFIHLTTRHLEDLRRLLTALCCGDRMTADDLAQDSLLKAYVQIDSLKDAEKFRAWLMKIAYTTFLNSRRALKQTEPVDNAIGLMTDSTADNSFDYQELYSALNRLTPMERTSVTLYYIEGYAIKEVAEIIGVSPEAVKQHIYRGRQHLRTLLTRL
ncbi:MAG: RNA polymerase sigma factor [Bacteroides sp.]|nr:RNA polymerase sigma factor [Bacteroides sp.]MBD5360161.1 RNA polymerase sigma factor [Bacteroides sp.]MBD5361616.1 RNA polymerase sigma factor [Bacteroides sp.]MBD5372682.1 RNA polymerase sigma factor [Bacteroides sp.]